MSALSQAWAWKQLPAIEHALDRLLLVKLSDQANDDGYCWPARKVLATQLDVHWTTITRAIGRLEDGGFLTREATYEENGSQAHNAIQLHSWRYPDDKLGGGSAATLRGGSTDATPRAGVLPVSSDKGMTKNTQPNPLWDALVTATGINPESKTERSRFGKTVKELQALGATPEEIAARWKRWCKNHDASVVAASTERALIAHWGELAGPAGVPPPAPCEDCGVGGGRHAADCASLTTA